MINTILSIDLDILFAPQIGIYNNLINNTINYESNWDNISDEYDIYNFLPNNKYYNILIDILNVYDDQVNKIYIGEDHSSILTALNNEKESFYTPYKFNIYNIDFHHDISYNQSQQIDIYNQIASCSNWVGFLSYYNFLEEYYWWSDPCSSFSKKLLLNEDTKGIMPKHFTRKELLIDQFPLDLQIDMLFITYSIPWIPPCYYLIIKDLLQRFNQDKIIYLQNQFLNNSLKPPFLSLPINKDYEYFKFLYDKKI